MSNTSTSSLYTQNSESAIFQSFMDKLHEEIGFESGSLFLLENESQALKEVAVKGDGIDFISSVHFPMGTGLSAWVAQKCKIIYLNDIHRGSRHGQNPVRSYLSMPLEMNTKVVGVLNLGHVVPNAFDDAKMEIIVSMAKEIARKIYTRKYIRYFTDEENSFD
jgi:GAF domain-containing protein